MEPEPAASPVIKWTVVVLFGALSLLGLIFTAFFTLGALSMLRTPGPKWVIVFPLVIGLPFAIATGKGLRRTYRLAAGQEPVSVFGANPLAPALAAVVCAVLLWLAYVTLFVFTTRRD